jgi:mannosyl-3-phosphoglycerate phosphatase
VPIRAFHELSAIEIAGLCGLPVPQAELAKRREYDEPFEVLDGAGAAALAAEVESLGRRWTRGGRFHHISGQNDKAKAVVLLIEMYQRLYGRVMTIGLGDAPNDAAFLNVVSIPVVVRSPNWHELKEIVPRARVSDTEGPAGWNTEVLEILSWFPQDAGRQR